jgi:copper homeostasis protein
MKMAEIAAERETVFHRAIDVTPDWREALDTLMAIGITRVLTSGHNRSAYFGAPVIAEMIRYAAGRIQILPGAGITPDNASEVIERTGCDQLHMSMHKYRADQSTAHNPDINFGGALYPPEDRFKTVDGERLARFNRMIKG